MQAGSITFSTALDNEQLEKDLQSLTKKIEKKEREIAELTEKRDQAQKKGVFDAAVLDEEKAKLQELKDRLADLRNMSKDKSYDLETREGYAAQISDVKQALEDQRTRVNALQKEWNQTESEVERYTSKLAEAENELHRQQDAAGGIVQELDKAKKESGKMQSATEQANERMARFGKRLKEILLSAFVFNVISRALTSLQQLTMKYIKTNDEARRAIAQLKGALLTLAQPLIEVVIPVFTLFVNILTKIITVVAQLVSSLFGKTIKQSQDGAKALHKEANAIGAVGEAAEEASGSLAGFDEINTISTENAKGAGGAGISSGDEIAPDFSWMDGMDSGFLDRLKEIADLVGLIGAGFALWKIGSMLPGVLGQIAKLLGGILLTVGGLLTFWNGLTDAWENGVDWLNLIEMIGGLAAAAFGLYTIFELLHPGWGIIAAGIALVVGGIAMLVTGFHDAMENGWNLQNTLLSIAGILATGLGIALITGSWIPLLVAGIVSVLLALTIATGHGEELLDGIKEVMKGLLDFFTGVFTGDWELAAQGLVEIFDGVDTSVTAVLEGVRDAFDGFLDWLDEKTGGRFHDIIEILRETVSGVIDGVEEILDGFTDFLTGIFTGDIETAIGGINKMFDGFQTAVSSVIDGAKDLLLGFLDWLDEKTGGRFHDIIETAKSFVTTFFDDVKSIVGEWTEDIKQIFQGIIQFVSGVFTGDWEKAWEGVKNIFKGVWNGMISLLEGAINLIVKGVNALISGINKLHIDIPDNPFTGEMRLGFNIPSIPEAKIPRLAQGAVIPPNREFLAVLGDQRSGTNIEAPLETIKQALAEVMQSQSGGEIVVNITTTLDGRVLARNQVRHINDMTRQAGKPVLLF